MVHAYWAGRACVILLALCGPACSGGYGPQPFADAGSFGRGGGGTGGMDGGTCSPTSCNGLGEYCATCGENAGKCVRGAPHCSYEPLQIVCGCDGKLYRSPCDGELVGRGFANDDRCAQPPGTFRCGTRFCTHGTQYCQTWYLDSVSNSTVELPFIASFACADLAAGCPATPTCACVTTSECGDCTVSADGDLTTMCRLPPV